MNISWIFTQRYLIDNDIYLKTEYHPNKYNYLN